MNLFLKGIKSRNLHHLLTYGTFGLEKESLRVDKNSLLSKKPHPIKWGNASNHPFITTDFSESQPEFVTPPLSSIEEVYDFMKNILIYCLKQLDDEFLWPYSMPCVLPSQDNGGQRPPIQNA